MGVCLDSFRLHLSDCQQWLYLKCGRNGNFIWEFFVKWENISTFAIQKELFDISKAQRIGAVVMSLNRYQQLLTSLLTSVTQIDTIFFIILGKDNNKYGITPLRAGKLSCGYGEKDDIQSFLHKILHMCLAVQKIRCNFATEYLKPLLK